MDLGSLETGQREGRSKPRILANISNLAQGNTACSGFVAFQRRTGWNAVERLPECVSVAALRPVLDRVPGFPTRHLGGKGNGHQVVDLNVFAGGKFLDLTGETVRNLSGECGHGCGWRRSLRKLAGWTISMPNRSAPAKSRMLHVTTYLTPASKASWRIGSSSGSRKTGIQP